MATFCSVLGVSLSEDNSVIPSTYTVKSRTETHRSNCSCLLIMDISTSTTTSRHDPCLSGTSLGKALYSQIVERTWCDQDTRRKLLQICERYMPTQLWIHGLPHHSTIPFFYTSWNLGMCYWLLFDARCFCFCGDVAVFDTLSIRFSSRHNRSFTYSSGLYPPWPGHTRPRYVTAACVSEARERAATS